MRITSLRFRFSQQTAKLFLHFLANPNEFDKMYIINRALLIYFNWIMFVFDADIILLEMCIYLNRCQFGIEDEFYINAILWFTVANGLNWVSGRNFRFHMNIPRGNIYSKYPQIFIISISCWIHNIQTYFIIVNIHNIFFVNIHNIHTLLQVNEAPRNTPYMVHVCNSILKMCFLLLWMTYERENHE